MKYNIMSNKYSIKELETILYSIGVFSIEIYTSINVIVAVSNNDIIQLLSTYQDIIVEENAIGNPCELKTQQLDNNWGLRILTNTSKDVGIVLSGFNIEYKNSTIINTAISNCSYTISNSLELSIGKNHIYLDKSYYIETKKPVSISNCLGYTNGAYASIFPINTPLFVQYNINTDSWVVSEASFEGYVKLYSVEVELINNTDALLASKGSVLYQFTNLCPIGPLEQSYKYASSGNNVAVIVGDTQLTTSRTDEFDNRIILSGNPYSLVYENDFLDPYYCSDYHGMAVASCIAGNTCGVAKHATIYGCTCLDITEEYGNRSDQIIAGLDNIAVTVDNLKAKNIPVIVCLAFTINSNTIVNDIIRQIVAKGALVITPIGDINATTGSPYHSTGLCVGAIDENISIYSGSKYGALVNIWAPGSSIRVASHEDGIFLTKNGTSFAAAYTTGICSLYLSLFPEASPIQIKTAVLASARNSVVYPKDDCTNKLLAPILYSEVISNSVKTPILAYNSLYVYIPFVIMLDGTKVYGNTIEVSVDKIGSAVVSAARLESINLATKLNLVG